MSADATGLRRAEDDPIGPRRVCVLLHLQHQAYIVLARPGPGRPLSGEVLLLVHTPTHSSHYIRPITILHVPPYTSIKLQYYFNRSHFIWPTLTDSL